MKIEGKTALVLGGIKGIGKEIGLALARQGAQVILTWYDWPESLPAMEEELNATGQGHMTMQVDLRHPGEIRTLFADIKSKYNSLDILINNIERDGMPVVHGGYTS
ncbi:MAG: SDR family NAD(P)-dependent oxidoreductase, partial [Desulfobia sp.]